jgi:hypothetical protein
MHKGRVAAVGTLHVIQQGFRLVFVLLSIRHACSLGDLKSIFYALSLLLFCLDLNLSRYRIFSSFP